MQDDTSVLDEASALGVLTHEDVRWRCHWKLEKFNWEGPVDELPANLPPWEVLEGQGNLLMYGGASILWELLIGAGGTVFSNANAHIGVGDSSTAAAATQTDLQAVTNKLRKAMDATYPIHVDGVTSPAASISFKSSFSSSEANYVWAEWAVFNALAAGRMLNRKVEALGTKTGGAWALTVTLTLA